MAIRNCADLGPNLQKIVTKLMNNDNLVNLLYYGDEDPLNKPHLTAAQKREKIFNKLIKIVPHVESLETEHCYIAITINSGDRYGDNKEFKQVKLIITVLVPYNSWIIKDSNLRPFSILGEIQNSLDGIRVEGLGLLQGGDFALTHLSEEMTEYSAEYSFTSYD